MAKSAIRMTVAEVMQDMRRRGQPISHSFLCDLMASGECPFATHLRTGATGRRTFLILRKDYENWINANLLGG